jgi:predicted TIM-barrel fold metal-dependent hydrolase
MNDKTVDRSWDFRQTLDVLDARYARMAPEPILDPDLPIIDPHHHLWDRPPQRYLLDEYLADMNTGHNIIGTVFVECTAMWRASGPEEMRPVGETEFVNGIAAMAASGAYGPIAVNAGIVSYADLRLGDAVEPVLEEHVARGGGRMRGIRNRATYEPLIGEYGSLGPAKGLLRDPQFRRGMKKLAAAGLVYDSWQYHMQIPDVADLARAVPEATIVLDHVGGVVGVGPFAGRREEVFAQWRRDMADLATCPNVFVKIGGLAMPLFGLGFNNREVPPGSEELAPAWQPFVETSIELFGADRCMFESNFPPDKQTCSYPVMWNTFKRIVADCSQDEKAALFAGTARKVYRLDV